MHGNKLTPRFNTNLEHLRNQCPPAAAFLEQLQAAPFWLGTVVNAHLYRGSDYLLYIRFVQEGLLIRGRRNRSIKSGVRDSHDAAQRALDAVMKNFTARAVDDTWVFTSSTEPEAYDALIARLRGLKLG